MVISYESWRTQAWCPMHMRQEPIARVRSVTPLRATGYETYTAVVFLECGEHLSIVTTSKNLAMIKEPA